VVIGPCTEVCAAGTATVMVHLRPQLLQAQERVSGGLPVQRTPSGSGRNLPAAAFLGGVPITCAHPRGRLPRPGRRLLHWPARCRQPAPSMRAATTALRLRLTVRIGVDEAKVEWALSPRRSVPARTKKGSVTARSLSRYHWSRTQARLGRRGGAYRSPPSTISGRFAHSRYRASTRSYSATSSVLACEGSAAKEPRGSLGLKRLARTSAPVSTDRPMT
jgi:hypothetical protein